MNVSQPCPAATPMDRPPPHYVLLSEATAVEGTGRWRFVLRSADGSEQFEVADVEPGVKGERLDLLTVVRALESLDQPSRVTLIASSRYVRQGVQYGLSQWRSNGWQWESFGQLVPVKNGDLWQRMDRALRFHQVECSRRRFDPPHRSPPQPRAMGMCESGGKTGGKRIRVSGQLRLRYPLSLLPAQRRRRISALLRWWRRRAVRTWTALKPDCRPG
jgi:ribonuclease HI